MIERLEAFRQRLKRELRSPYARMRRFAAGHVRTGYIPLHPFWFVIMPWINRAAYAAVKLGVPDLLVDGPMSSAEIAARVGCDAKAIEVSLTALESVKFTKRDADGRWRQTPTSGAFVSGVPGTLRDWLLLTAESVSPTPKQFLEVVRTGRPPNSGGGKSIWDAFVASPEDDAAFDHAMASASAHNVGELARAYNFAQHRVIMDVAGGKGITLTTILRAHPGPRGIIFDRPTTIGRARQFVEDVGMTDRCSAVGGSFFDEIPTGADLYMIKHALHDWGDSYALKILTNMRRALGPDGTLMVVDAVIHPRGPVDRVTKVMALQQIASTDEGYERTRADFDRLFGEAGLKIEKIVHTFFEDMSLIIARAADAPRTS